MCCEVDDLHLGVFAGDLFFVVVGADDALDLATKCLEVDGKRGKAVFRLHLLGAEFCVRNAGFDACCSTVCFDSHDINLLIPRKNPVRERHIRDQTLTYNFEMN